MAESRHYREDRKRREATIQQIGLGEVIYTTVKLDPKRGKEYIYEITTNAILIVRPKDEPSLIITKMIARPNRLKAYWENIEQENKEVFQKAIAHARAKMYY